MTQKRIQRQKLAEPGIDELLMGLSPRTGQEISAKREHTPPHLYPDTMERLDALEARHLTVGIPLRMGEDHYADMCTRRREIISMLAGLEGTGYDYVDFAALLARRHGRGEEFREYLADARLLDRADVIFLPSIGNIALAVSENLVEDSLKVLQGSKNAMSCEDVTASLGYDLSDQDVRRHQMAKVNYALNLLDVLGDVVKLPQAGHASMWCDAGKRETAATIPTWNLSHNLMLILSQNQPLNAAAITELAIESGALAESEHTIGNGLTYRAPTCFIERALDNLYVQGMISKETVVVGRRRTYIYSMTERGSHLLDDTLSSNFLSEEYRLALLGERYGSFVLSRMRMADGISDGLDVLDLRGENPGWGERRVAKHIGLGQRFVQNVFERGLPLYSSSREYLESCMPFLPEDKREKFKRYLDGLH